MTIELKRLSSDFLSSRAFMYACLISTLLSAGAWLGAYFLGPDHVSETLRIYYYNQANDYYHSSAWPEDCERYRYWDQPPHRRFDWCHVKYTKENLDELIQRDVEENIEKYHKWISRQKIQRPSFIIFLVSLFPLTWSILLRRATTAS